MKKIKKEDLSLNPKTVAHLSEDARKVSDSENANKAGKWLSEDKKCEDYTFKNCFKTDQDECHKETFGTACMCPKTESCIENVCGSMLCTKSQGMLCCAPQETASPATCAVPMTTKCQGTEVCLKTQNNCILSENGNCEFKPGLLTEEDNCVQTVDNCPAE